MIFNIRVIAKDRNSPYLGVWNALLQDGSDKGGLSRKRRHCDIDISLQTLTDIALKVWTNMRNEVCSGSFPSAASVNIDNGLVKIDSYEPNFL